MESSGVFGLRFLALLLISAVLSVAAMEAAAATIRLDPILQGLSTPVYVTNARDGTNRLFVVEQAGRVKALAAGATAPRLFLDITSKVRFDGEQGLLGLAFHPQFATNSRFFVDYTRVSDGATVIAEYRASADPDVTAASETVLLVIAQPRANANGGMIEFGSDGSLYIGMGDGGDANDRESRARNVDEPLGRILRIDVDQPADPDLHLSPASDAYAGASPGRDETFAVGIRSPFRFSFDRETGQLYVGDVGQRPPEEIGSVTAGGNRGWRVDDGTRCAGLDPALCVPANFVAPIAQYNYSDGRCSIIGGYVYRGAAAALPAGTYVFGDFCTGEIFSLAGGGPNLLLDTSSNISSFGEDEAGEIYVVGLGGTVHRIASTATAISSSDANSGSTPLSKTINDTTATAAATFVGTDVATKGNWQGVYGAQGYNIINDSTSYPAYAQVTPTGQQSCVWNAQPGSDVRALQRATTGRIAACWYSPGLIGSSFSVDVNLTDGAAHRVALYLLDWDNDGRAVRVDVLDAATQQVLSTQNVPSFSGGTYLVWNLQGHVIVRLTSTGGSNAVLSGLFFDAPAGVTTYAVSGTVTSGGNPLPGVSFSAPGNSCTTSNAQGQYSCTVPQGWTGSITPSLSGYAFTPASRSYSSVAANQAGQDYTATSTTVPNSATFVGADAATQGNWQGVYGAQGYNIINDSTSYPAYAQVTPTGQQSCVWNAQPGSDVRALQRATTGRIAACWYSPGLIGSSFSVDVNLTDGAAHRLALYLLDWDSTTRVNRVDVLDAATQQVLSTQTLQSFNGGVYLVWNLQGHVIVRITSTGGSNAVLSGLFFDAPAGLTTYTVSGTVTTGGNPLPGVSFAATGTASCPGASNTQGQYSCTVPQGWTGSITPSLSGYAFTPTSRSYSSVAANQTGQNYTATSTVVPNSATFVGTDVATKGNWRGVYGADGYAILNDSTSYPAYAQVAASGQQSYVWDAQPNSDPRALQRATSGRIAACWYSPGLIGSSFSIDVNLTDGAAHRVALYLLDWDSTTRVNRVDVLDAATQQVLSTQTLQSFNGGVYLVWNLQGHVIVRITSTGGSNAVLSGLFFDAPAGLTTYSVSGAVTRFGIPLPGVSFTATGTASCPNASNAQGQYSCTVPQGWSGSIAPALSGWTFTPAARTYSSVAANQTGQDYTATNVATTTTTLTGSGSPVPVGSSVTFTATVTGSNPTGLVSVTEGGEIICVTAALSGSPRTASCSTDSLAVGVHSIVANYGGDAFNFGSSSSPLSQVISGTTLPAAATFVGTDVATKGNWHGVYGAQGYNIINDSTSYPAYAQVTPTGQQSCVWDVQPDSDVRALQRATSGRIAACWYSPGLIGSSFSIDVNLTDGAAHRVALYLLDWDSTTRVNRVDVLDAATQQVLSTQTLQSFNGGVYLVWNLQGHVIVRITSTGGSNAVLSGLFFDAPAGLTTYTVSGTVTTGGNPLPGVSFAATGIASCPGASNTQGQYSCTVPQGFTGSITPSLSGNAFTPASRSYSSVAANQTAQNYTAASAAATTTTLTSAPNPATAGSSVTFTATVTGNNPTGSVSFTEGGNAICAAGTLGGSPRTASCSTSALSVGTHSIVANYAGDSGNAASTSAPLAQTINGSGLTLTLSGTVYADNGQPLAGVRFDASAGQFSCPDSDSSGHYFCTVPEGWSGTITPSLAGYQFEPLHRTYDNVTADDTQDYLGTPH